MLYQINSGQRSFVAACVGVPETRWLFTDLTGSANGSFDMELLIDDWRINIVLDTTRATGFVSAGMRSDEAILDREWALKMPTNAPVVLTLRRQQVELSLGGDSVARLTLRPQAHRKVLVKTNRKMLISDEGRSTLQGWRSWATSSGIDSPLLHERPLVRTGLTALIRMKDEVRTIATNVDLLAELVDQVVVADNGSIDGSLESCLRVKLRHKNVEVWEYNVDVPVVGDSHAAMVRSGSANTLATYYNFVLEKARFSNVIKWDADFIPIVENLRLMIDQFQLRSRTDPIAVWCTGRTVWHADGRYWIDPTSNYNEFRVLSYANGARWVNLLNWEEWDQTYLYSALLYGFEAPVFLEVKDLATEASSRPLVSSDARDRGTASRLDHFSQYGELPPDFVEIDLAALTTGLADHPLPEICQTLTAGEKTTLNYMLRKYSSKPHIQINGNDSGHAHPEEDPHDRLVVLCITHSAQIDRIRTIRESLGYLLKKLRIPLYFVIGAATSTRLDGDFLRVSVPDTYEYLPEKVDAALRYVHRAFPQSGVLKIDDDCLIDPELALQIPFEDAGYVGGRIAGGPNADATWHANKTDNPQLGERLEVPNISHWYGGGYTYMLSSRAISAYVSSTIARPRDFLYEDVMVGSVMKECGFTTALEDGVDYSVRLSRGDDWPTGVTGLADISSAERYWAIYKSMLSSHERGVDDAVRICTEWDHQSFDGENLNAAALLRVHSDFTIRHETIDLWDSDFLIESPLHIHEPKWVGPGRLLLHPVGHAEWQSVLFDLPDRRITGFGFHAELEHPESPPVDCRVEWVIHHTSNCPSRHQVADLKNAIEFRLHRESPYAGRADISSGCHCAPAVRLATRGIEEGGTNNAWCVWSNMNLEIQNW